VLALVALEEQELQIKVTLEVQAPTLHLTMVAEVAEVLAQ
jgi:hypothetical protein